MAPLDELFLRVRLAATRVDRAQERNLGRFLLDAGTAETLGRDGIGMLVARCEDLASVVRCLRSLDSDECTMRWLLMTDSKVNASYVRDHWQDPDTPDILRKPRRRGIRGDEPWASKNVFHGTVENVAKMIRMLDARPRIAGIFLLDPAAHVHRAREMRKGNFRISHDRPQVVVDLRSLLSDQGWSPPLFILTEKEPRAVETEAITRAYCLDALQYLDGRTLLISR